MAHEWANVDPEQYLAYSLDMGNNAIFCQAYTFGGYAFYPSRLGPVAPGPGQELLPRLYELTRKAGLPFWSYFCVGTDLVVNSRRSRWTIPDASGDRGYFLAPESPWTDLPYWKAKEPIWINHPMLNESDGLFAECTRPEVMDWLLDIKKPGQRLITTLIGRTEEDECNPDTWRTWYDRGCDFFGYTWATPPDFRPLALYDRELKMTREAFRAM